MNTSKENQITSILEAMAATSKMTNEQVKHVYGVSKKVALQNSITFVSQLIKEIK